MAFLIILCLPSKLSAQCWRGRGGGQRGGRGRNQCLLLELSWYLFLSPNAVFGFPLKRKTKPNHQTKTQPQTKTKKPPRTKKPNYGCRNTIILGAAKPQTSSSAVSPQQSPLQNFSHFFDQEMRRLAAKMLRK